MPPEHEMQNKPASLNSFSTILFAIIVSGILFCAGIYFSNNVPLPSIVLNNNTNATTTKEITISPVTETDHILGNPNAPVKIIEFSDPECPFCKQFHTTMHQIMNIYEKTGRVAWVYREYPIPSLHKRAPNEVEAMECANVLGGNTKFWEYTDQIFSTTQSNDSLDPAQLPIIARNIGLDVNSFNVCLSTNKYTSLITTESLDAINAGANGTPFSVLVGPNGEKVSFSGAQTFNVMKSLVDSVLNQIPNQSY